MGGIECAHGLACITLAQWLRQGMIFHELFGLFQLTMTYIVGGPPPPYSSVDLHPN